MTVTTNITIHGEANIFVVPNTAIIACKDPSFEPNESLGISPNQDILDGLKEMARLNHKTFDAHDPLVQVWYMDEDNSDMKDHPVEIGLNGETYRMRFRTADYIPYSYLKDMREGKTLWLKIPVTLINKKDDSELKAVWSAELIAKQLEYRYRRHGRFEDVLDSVVKASKRLYHGCKSHDFKYQYD